MSEYVIGIMSGSSLDGLDMALCSFDEKDKTIIWNLIDSQTLTFPEEIRNALIHAPSFSGKELMKLDAEFGMYIGRQIYAWTSGLSFKPKYIASHGHTVFHEPREGFTTQIGSGAHIAFESGIDTITSFRNADVAAGGQGAPFAPAADRILFPGYEAYLNLGGIANIHLISSDDAWKAWDIGPCNQVLNYLAARSGQPFDKDGALAAGGTIHPGISEALLEMYPPLNGKPRGLSNAEVYATWISMLEESKEKNTDLLASVTDAIAQMILRHISPLIKQPGRVLVTGGGAHNIHLLNRIKKLSEQFQISFDLPAKPIINFKECLLMAYLGYLTIHEQPYSIHHITGASANTIGGAVFKAYR